MPVERVEPARVADKQLVRPLPELTDHHAVLASELGHVIKRHTDGIADRLVLELHHPRQEVDDVRDPYEVFVMCRADAHRHLTSVRKLAGIGAIRVGIPNRERLDLGRLVLRKERGVGAGVEAARQEHPHGHIADLAEPNRGPELSDHTIGDLVFAHSLER